MKKHIYKAQSKKYRADIDGLRAIAVLLVIGFHAFPEWVKGGFIGVDVFFVISGFLISTIIISDVKANNFSLTDFYIRRVRRIFPALILVLTCSLIVGWFVLLPQEYATLGLNTAAGAGFVSNWILWLESGYFDASAELKPLLHLWSLGIEEQFYIVWPIVLSLVIAKRFNLWAVLLACGIASFTLNVYTVATDAVYTFYLPFTRFWELICGALLANWNLKRYLYESTKISIIEKNIASIVGFGLIIIGALTITKVSVFPGWLALIPVIGTLLLIASNNYAYLNKTILSNKYLVEIGLISFPLYLWHWPLLVFAKIIENDTPNRYVRIFAVFLSIILAWLTYKVIEKPFRFGKKSLIKTALLLILMFTVGVSGYLIYKSDGVKYRYPRSYQQYVEKIDFKWPEYVRFDECHIQSLNIVTHAPVCSEIARPLIALWGDSHASSLYPGLKKKQQEYPFGIVQLTSAGCPPLLSLNDLRYQTKCNEINQSVLTALVKDKPDILILHAAWMHEQYPLTDKELAEKLNNTLKTIQKKIPRTRIIVLGPTPRWKGSPQSESFRFLRAQSNKNTVVPEMQNAEKLNQLEILLRLVSQENHVEYVSLIDAFCEKDKCLARVGDDPVDFVAIDYGHLSKKGSEYLINKISNKIF